MWWSSTATASVSAPWDLISWEALSRWWECSLSVDTLSQCGYSYGVKIIKLAWVGTRTENFQPTVDFFEMSWTFDRKSTFLDSVC